MQPRLLGIHHITALCADPQRNLDFYVKFMGLRLVKRTINYDDPGTYHLYYGDHLGSPGTILTFFPYPDAARGHRGAGQVVAIAFAIDPASIPFWSERLARHGMNFEGPRNRFDEEVILFEDPDGLQIELVAHPDNKSKLPVIGGSVPTEHALRGFYGVTINSLRTDSSLRVLQEYMGFVNGTKSAERVRLAIGEGIDHAHVDILTGNEDSAGQSSAGSVHHIAWRVADTEAQLRWRAQLALYGFNVTPVVNRKYFHSIYYREPGGVLYEIATDAPGFAVDETPDTLGSQLRLPPWLESDRERIARRLPPLSVPA
jgi:glyoxalase family protein